MSSVSNSFVYLLFINQVDSLVVLQFTKDRHKLKILSKFWSYNVMLTGFGYE